MVVYVVVDIVFYLLMVLQALMLVRAVASWFVDDDDGPFMRFLYWSTEPIILPFRKLFDRVEALREFPLDVPFLATVLALSLLEAILSSIPIVF